jgi:hypothetical protein
MKKTTYSLLFLAMLCLSSCFEVDEQFDFKANGSIDFAYNIDLGKTVTVLTGMMPDSSKKKDKQFNAAVDTTLNFYTASDGAAQKRMNQEETYLAKNSNITVDMNLSKGVMKASIKLAAKNAADFDYFIHNLSKMPSLSKKLSEVTKDDNKTVDTTGARALMEYEDYYSYEVTAHKFYRIVDTAKFGPFSRKNAQTIAMAKGLKMTIPYKLTLNFASPVKNVTSSIAKLSPDKKRVTLETDMEAMTKNPSILNLKVDY